MTELFGFSELRAFATRNGTKVVKDDYTGAYTVVSDYYSSAIYRAHKAARGWNPASQRWNYAVSYQESIVCRVFGDPDVGELLEDYPPTWIQYTRTAIRNAVGAATGSHETPCIAGTVDGILWYGHNYVRHYQNYVNIPMAMMDGRLAYEVVGDDSHGWFGGIKRKLINSLWEDWEEQRERDPYALVALSEYAGYLYSLAYHVCDKAGWHTPKPSLSAIDTAAMFSSYWQAVMGRKISRPVEVKYYQNQQDQQQDEGEYQDEEYQDEDE